MEISETSLRVIVLLILLPFFMTAVQRFIYIIIIIIVSISYCIWRFCPEQIPCYNVYKVCERISRICRSNRSLFRKVKRVYETFTRPRPAPTGSHCSLKAAAHFAFTTKGTVLYTNEGYIYWSEEYRHAEEVFIEMTRDDVTNIHTIWIKNSPCSRCADKLIEHFALQPNKPTMYIGKIWTGDYGDEESNEEGLRRMTANGFELLVWKHDKNKNEYETREYLNNIDNYSCMHKYLRIK